jgi:hypothetical protein
VTDGIFFIAIIMFFSHEKSLNVKISNNFFHFSHHIPYVAKKKIVIINDDNIDCGDNIDCDDNIDSVGQQLEKQITF